MAMASATEAPTSTGLGTLAADLQQYVERYRTGALTGHALGDMMKSGTVFFLHTNPAVDISVSVMLPRAVVFN
jgi:hypothetical protein